MFLTENLFFFWIYNWSVPGYPTNLSDEHEISNKKQLIVVADLPLWRGHIELYTGRNENIRHQQRLAESIFWLSLSCNRQPYSISMLNQYLYQTNYMHVHVVNYFLTKSPFFPLNRIFYDVYDIIMSSSIPRTAYTWLTNKIHCPTPGVFCFWMSNFSWVASL